MSFDMEKLKEYMRQQYRQERLEAAFGDCMALSNCRFEEDNGQVPSMEQARRYVQKWDRMQRYPMGMIFWGPPGTGKTFAAACIANALLEREDSPTVKMTTLGTVLNKLPTLTPADKEYYLKGLIDCGLLILDDFGMERRTDYAREQVFHIIDGRYRTKRPMVVTTNLSLKELKHPADMAERRIYDRLQEVCIPVCFDGDNIRQLKGKERLDWFRQELEG